MSLSPFGRKVSKSKYRSRSGLQSSLRDVTLSDFGGGLNLIEAELKLKTDSATALVNAHKDLDGSLSMRYGCAFQHDISSAVSGDIIEMVYFNDKLVCFTDDGEIATINSAGTITAIWNETIANALSGSPSGWSDSLVSIDYTEFKGELVVCNGEDKPIIIADDHSVTYLQDIPTGSNVYTPVGFYVTTVSNYVVIAGISGSENEIYISSAGTSGTWPGDTAPNDSTSINVAAYAADAGSTIKGLSSFRNFLIVHFEKVSVVFTLGTYDGSTHTPTPSDNIPAYGILGHRCSINLVNDFVFCDRLGVYSGRRNVFGAAIETKALSDKVTPLYAKQVPFAAADQVKSFAVHNPLEKRIMFFLLNDATWYIHVMSYTTDLKKVGWSIFEDWTFTCGCSTAKNRVYFARGSKVFLYGNGVYTDEGFTADNVDEYDSSWLTATAYVVDDRVLQSGTVYQCLTDHTSGTFTTDLASGFWEEYQGDPIDFDWTLPWSDFGIRARKKQLKYLSADTKGTGVFTAEVYVDDILVDENDANDPAIMLEYSAGDTPGYGGGAQPFGGGRVSTDPRHYGFPVEFKKAKLRFHRTGTDDVGRVKFESVTLLYHTGNYHR